MSTERTGERKEEPFRLDQCGDLSSLRQALEAVEYTRSALAKIVMRLDTGRMDTIMLSRRVASPSPFHTIVRLFFLGQTVPLATVHEALAPAIVEPLITIGLLQPTGTDIRSEAMLIPADDLLVVQDFPAEVMGGPELANHVLGAGRASLTLANLTVRRQGEFALDLGTGSGVQAILAARHASQVIATDISPRALQFAALTARLNSISNIELRCGSLYEPVGDCQFDLIVANPPFVISPESRYIYRDSGLPGDTISEQVIRGAAARLREGGYSVTLCNWYYQEGQEWFERPRQWVTESGCDAWLLCYKNDDPLTYAANWLRTTEGNDGDHYGQLLDTWLRYYKQIGIDWISSGVVILRRRSDRTNWLRTDIVPPQHGNGSCSTQIQHIFATQDLLERLADERQLLDYTLVLNPDHRMEHVLTAEDGGWTVQEALLKHEQGLEFVGRVDRLVSAILAGCNGQHTLRELVADVAQGVGIDFDAAAPASLGVVRKLMQWGFLSVAEPQAQ